MRVTRSASFDFILSFRTLLVCKLRARLRTALNRLHPRRLARFLSRAVSLLLSLTLLSTSAPAAPMVLSGVASEVKGGFAFWYRASGWADLLAQFAAGGQHRPTAPAAQERQEARTARVARVQLAPGDVTVHEGESVNFTAVGYDAADAPIGGLPLKWSGRDVGRDKPVRVSPRGEFKATAAGEYQVTVETAGKKAQAKVIVVEGARLKKGEPPKSTRQVSTRDVPVWEGALRKREARPVARASADSVAEDAPAARGARFVNASFDGRGGPSARLKARAASAAASMAYMLPADGWNELNYPAADDPGNQPGNPPTAPADGGAGSGNFQIAAPVLNLPGRGMDMTLGLAYNSRVWSKSGSQMIYDIDHDWPAPGWSLGFGKMVGLNTAGSMLIEPDGTRRAFNGTVSNYGTTVYFNGYSIDGSFIDYWSYSYNGNIASGYARLPNGTWIDYGAAGDGAIYPTRITDANGNYVTIAYVNNQGPRIQTITDTLGRAVNFYYDGYGLLTAVTGPGLGGTARTLVRLHYHQHYLQYGFAYPLTGSARNAYPWVIDAVYYPATATGYWFGDSDSYSSYGMISKVVEQRAMGFSAASLNDQGVVYAGALTRQTLYNYPLTPASPPDAPTYTTKTETWTRDGVNTDQSVTSYSAQPNASPRTVSITQPDGTRNVQYSYNAPGQYYDGLVYRDETYDAAGNLLRYNTSDWEPGAYSSPRPTRTAETDERGQTKATEFSYGAVYNEITEVRSLDYANALVRATRTQYNNSASYTNRHIFSLPTVVEVYAGDGVTRVSRTDYQYDGQTLSDTPGVVQHSDASNPYAPVYWVDGPCYYDCSDPYYGCYYTCDPGYWTTDYDPSTDYRGNVTQVTKYADAANLTGAVVESHRYDITGNDVTTSTACCEQTSLAYTSDTQYAYATTQTRGSATDASARLTTSATYDFNTGLKLSTTNPNGRTSQVVYYADTLRPQYEYSATGAYTAYAYDEAAMSITMTSYTAGGAAIGEQSVKRLNGEGAVRREEILGAGGAWDVVETEYDSMGRVSRQSRPYRSGQESPQWSVYTYDALGRVVSEQSPDGSATSSYYNEASRPNVASAAAGETVRVVDPWGRERWARFDALGRVVEVVEPEPNSAGAVAQGGMVTTYGYNALDKLTSVAQGSQTRSFRYDSLGRMTHQKLAERSATLNDAGQYVGGGTWSDVFAYDDRSNLTSHVDARGVRVLYNYNSDPLNRLQSITYDLSGFGDAAHPVASTPTVSYQYRSNAGGTQLVDVSQLSSVYVSGVGTQGYSYDGEGRVQTRSLTFDGRPSYPLAVDYIYDTLDRVTDVRYPAQYGFGGAARKLVHQDFDAAGRTSALQVDGATYASEISYNAASQATRIRVGYAGSNQKTETYDYDAATGLLAHQAVTQDGNPNALLDLTYDYLRAGTTSGRTGQLTRVINNRDRGKDHGYEYDALGRLLRATGGQSVSRAERYSYDRYGNRANSYSYNAEQYVRNFYQSALGRQPSASELQYWLGQLQAAYVQGPSQYLSTMSALGDALFSSSEYAARGRSDHDYVYDLYKAYLFREPDQGGWDFWTSQVPYNGRAGVRNGFAGSIEFNWKMAGTSPYSLPGGVVPHDGWEALSYDQASNHVNLAGWEYDAAGNQTRAQRGTDGAWQRYQYDAVGRLARVTDDYGNTLASYTYGEEGQRLLTDEPGLRTYYAWNGDAVIAEFQEGTGASSPSWQKNYVYLGGRLLATQQASGGAELVQYHHPDMLGTRLVTNAADASVSEQVTLPFGVALDAESSGVPSNRRFTSYDRSGRTTLDYAVSRHYDAAQGRFTQVDPIGMQAVSLEHPQTLNLYAYCGNDPVNHTDPSGLFFGWLKKLFKGIGKVVSAVANVVAKVLNNRWVRIGMLVASFLVGMPFLGQALNHVLQTALNIYNRVSDIVSQLQLLGQVLTGKFKEFFTSVGLGIVSSALSVVEDNIRQSVKEALSKNDHFSFKNFTFKKFFGGVWTGMRHAGKAIFGRGFLSLIPAYGLYCGPDYTYKDYKANGVDGVDSLCKTHDQRYDDAAKALSQGDIAGARFITHQADTNLFKGLFTAVPRLHIVDIAFGGRPSAGSYYKFGAIPLFGIKSLTNR